jgi:hypothetical protein
MARMAISNRPHPDPDRIIIAGLYGTALRRGGWHKPTGIHRNAAIEEIRDVAAGRTDLLAEAAGVMLGTHPAGDVQHARYRIAADLILEAADLTEGHPDVQHWIAVGERRRQNNLAARRIGDPNAPAH